MKMTLSKEEIKKIKQETGKTYVCKYCGFADNGFGVYGRHLRTCSARPGKDVVKAEKVREAKPVEGKEEIQTKSVGFTSVKVTPVDHKPMVMQRPKPPEKPPVEISPIVEKIRREKWECSKCMYQWYPTQKPGKCPNCGSPRIRVTGIEEELEGTPKLDARIFRPIVAFPYDAWADKSGIEELRLAPAEIDLLSENLANVANYYMADWMREHGIIIALIVALSVVTIPKVYIYQTKKGSVEKEKEEKELKEKIKPETAQPEEENEEVEEKKPELSQSEKENRMMKKLMRSGL